MWNDWKWCFNELIKMKIYENFSKAWNEFRNLKFDVGMILKPDLRLLLWSSLYFSRCPVIHLFLRRVHTVRNWRRNLRQKMMSTVAYLHICPALSRMNNFYKYLDKVLFKNFSLIWKFIEHVINLTVAFLTHETLGTFAREISTRSRTIASVLAWICRTWIEYCENKFLCLKLLTFW